MPATKQPPTSMDEPMGIVISRGSRAEAVPVFRAFEYCPGPQDEAPIVAPQAA